MAAEQRVEIPSLPLLLEPSVPLPRERVQHGWRGEVGGVVRDHDDDSWGAVVQHIIVRYLVGGESRARLAAEFGMSERQIQSYLGGRAWQPYSRPVLHWLNEHGIPEGHGVWDGRGANARPAQVIGALMTLGTDAANLLELRMTPKAQDVVLGLRLLCAAQRRG